MINIIVTCNEQCETTQQNVKLKLSMETVVYIFLKYFKEQKDLEIFPPNSWPNRNCMYVFFFKTKKDYI